MSGIEGQETVQLLTTVLFALARGVQVWQNFAQVCTASAGIQLVINVLVLAHVQGSTGELAVATLFMNFAGSAARIFTSSQEVKEPIVMYSFIISTVLNGVLLVQVRYLSDIYCIGYNPIIFSSLQWIYYRLSKSSVKTKRATAERVTSAEQPPAASSSAPGVRRR